MYGQCSTQTPEVTTPVHGSPLLTLTITEDGEVQAHPGLSFTPEHMTLLIEAAGAVQDVLAGQAQAV